MDNGGKARPDHAVSRLNGYVLQGAGELLLWNASDFKNFMAPRPEWQEFVEQVRTVTRVIASHQWPIRIHATYDETISRILDVFESVFNETGCRSRWAIDHAETITPRNIARIKAMGGGMAVQDRAAFAGEYFAKRYGTQAAASAPPLRALVDAGIPVGVGTDATRVSSYNPWPSLEYLGMPGAVPQVFYDQIKYQRYDLSEFSLSSFMVERAHGWPYRLLPVFHNRNFSYTSIVISKASGIRQGHPEDLNSKRFAVMDYQQTAALWIRGVLKHEFGVEAADMEWFQTREANLSHMGASGSQVQAGVKLNYADADFGRCSCVAISMPQWGTVHPRPRASTGPKWTCPTIRATHYSSRIPRRRAYVASRRRAFSNPITQRRSARASSTNIRGLR